MTTGLVGAVLCGGSSRRMGRDKALVEVDGVPLAARVAAALGAAGCRRVLAVGGDASALGALGLEPVADRWPGEGPLGGLATAMAATVDRAGEGAVLVLAPCDLVAPAAGSLVELVEALDETVGAAHPVVDGRAQWLPSAWRVGTALAAEVAGLVDGGARRLDAVAALGAARAVVLTREAVADADTPAELP
ncbi:NTP transferase domain-containing protein [Iamia sp. SCSIO 61187]|uniref:molybdenum cofactor guanylyltransferase n=1 Tax=Iamia sp. SCSIO 61187 TaxID=2722752 RepID=UPI001C627817|nr:NTP transferase domain-containing protein [Iamia sp. SCSIO 61187]QYG92869.1 NTP transferase domain-containing protein [Iamia sp. SCSIO 61187]